MSKPGWIVIPVPLGAVAGLARVLPNPRRGAGARGSPSHPVFDCLRSPPDPVTLVVRDQASGKRKFGSPRRDRRLARVSSLQALGTTWDSQTLEFFKTSFQATRISPPRYLTPSDQATVGYVRGSNLLERAGPQAGRHLL